jgi:hypothetical protein
MRATVVVAFVATCALGACGRTDLFNAGDSGSEDAGLTDAGATAGDGGPESCPQLISDYSGALASAITCVANAIDQCQALTLSLDCTNCYRGVQHAATLDALRSKLLAQGCIQPAECPCVRSGPGTCRAIDAGSQDGTCGN